MPPLPAAKRDCPVSPEVTSLHLLCDPWPLQMLKAPLLLLLSFELCCRGRWTPGPRARAAFAWQLLCHCLAQSCFEKLKMLLYAIGVQCCTGRGFAEKLSLKNGHLLLHQVVLQRRRSRRSSKRTSGPLGRRHCAVRSESSLMVPRPP